MMLASSCIQLFCLNYMVGSTHIMFSTNLIAWLGKEEEAKQNDNDGCD